MGPWSPISVAAALRAGTEGHSSRPPQTVRASRYAPSSMERPVKWQPRVCLTLMVHVNEPALKLASTQPTTPSFWRIVQCTELAGRFVSAKSNAENSSDSFKATPELFHPKFKRLHR